MKMMIKVSMRAALAMEGASSLGGIADRVRGFGASLLRLLVMLTAMTAFASQAQAQLNNAVVAVSVVTYFHNDVSGTPMSATDANGNILWKENYRPYGDRVVNAPVASANNKMWFAGKPHDANTGLSYMGARYYDPLLGRFVAIDPEDFDPNNVHSFNRYAYANNNPYRFVDPEGRSPLDVAFLVFDLGKLGVAMYTGVGVSGALQDVASSVVGVASPIPGTGQAIKALRAADRGVDLARSADRAGDAVRGASSAASSVTQSAAKTVAKNGETAATKRGREAHKNWDAGPGFEKEVRLKNNKRVDAVNYETRHVKELKPDNPRAIRAGEKQVEGYRKQLELETKKKFTSSVETY